MCPDWLDDSPYILSCMTELAACDAGTETVVTDTYRIVFDMVREVVVALGHCADENRNALVLVQSANVISYTDDFRLEAERDLPAVRWQMVGDWILDDLNELLLGRG